LTTVTEDLLLITRAESHLLALHRAPTDPNVVVHTTLNPLRRRILQRDLTVEEFLDPIARPISVDPVLVARLVEHLLDNAVKYTPIGGRIIVRTEAAIPADKGVRFVVENSGPSLAPADLPHVFEPFYRADEARTRGEGTGLGLALVAAIARLHGGTARVMNGSGEGVRFEVDLPALTPPA
jgi:signal transduction histidine kinase